MKSTKKAKNAAPTQENLVRHGRESIAVALAGLRELIQRQTKDLSALKKYDQGAASHLAWLTKQVAQVTAELSKLDDRDRRASGKLTAEQVIRFLEGLPEDDRIAIIDEVEAFADKSSEGVLG